jgi:hypothetical protein
VKLPPSLEVTSTKVQVIGAASAEAQLTLHSASTEAPTDITVLMSDHSLVASYSTVIRKASVLTFDGRHYNLMNGDSERARTESTPVFGKSAVD